MYLESKPSNIKIPRSNYLLLVFQKIFKPSDVFPPNFEFQFLYISTFFWRARLRTYFEHMAMIPSHVYKYHIFFSPFSLSSIILYSKPHLPPILYFHTEKHQWKKNVLQDIPMSGRLKFFPVNCLFFFKSDKSRNNKGKLHLRKKRIYGKHFFSLLTFSLSHTHTFNMLTWKKKRNLTEREKAGFYFYTIFWERREEVLVVKRQKFHTHVRFWIKKIRLGNHALETLRHVHILDHWKTFLSFLHFSEF